MKNIRVNKAVQIGLAISLLLILSLFQNCSKTKFGTTGGQSLGGQNAMALPGQVDANGFIHSANSCYYELHKTTVPIKLVFMVDTSGSNAGANGSDPGKVVRAGSIQQFFDDYKGKNNFKWSLNSFQDATASALINNGLSSDPRFGVAADMQVAIIQFSNISDDHYTPYKAAINMANQVIANDSAVTSTTKYIVVFLSDGMPTDYGSPINDSLILSDVQTMIGIRPGKVSFNTIYYGDADPTASNRLKSMAMAGSGQFLDTNANTSGKSFSISDTISVPGSTCAP